MGYLSDLEKIIIIQNKYESMKEMIKVGEKVKYIKPSGEGQGKRIKYGSGKVIAKYEYHALIDAGNYKLSFRYSDLIGGNN